MLLEKQRQTAWGDKWLNQLSRDLRESFPNNAGFSRTNLHYIRQFAAFYPDKQIVQHTVGQLPWGHNVVLLTIADTVSRLWYAKQSLAMGWSRKSLLHAMKQDLYSAQGDLEIKVSNYQVRLSEPLSTLAQETLKDPYKFHFLTLGEEAEEKDIEDGLVRHITDFLLELGHGFAYCGRQKIIKVSNKAYKIDLLFYHYRLHCFVVIEIKRGEFKPSHAGQLNFYLSAVDSSLKSEQDNPSIGILFCERKDKIVAEYALRDLNKPIGISEFQLLPSIPENMAPYLPTIEELEEELSAELPDTLSK